MIKRREKPKFHLFRNRSPKFLWEILCWRVRPLELNPIFILNKSLDVQIEMMSILIRYWMIIAGYQSYNRVIWVKTSPNSKNRHRTLSARADSTDHYTKICSTILTWRIIQNYLSIKRWAVRPWNHIWRRKRRIKKVMCTFHTIRRLKILKLKSNISWGIWCWYCTRWQL